MTPKRVRQRGFTLMEVLIALFIFVIVMVIMTSGFGVAIQAERQVDEVSDKLGEIQIAEALISRDVAQAVNRPILDVDGTLLPAFIVNPGQPQWLEFTRSGVINPLARATRSTMMRVGYDLDKDVLIRKSWRVLDRAPTTVPDSRVLLTGVRSVALSVLNADNLFVEVTEPLQILPIAVKVDIEFINRERLSRTIRIVGVPKS